MDRKIILLVILMTALSAAAQSQTNTPLATLQAFYKYDRSHSQTFSRSAIEGRKQWFSTRLYRLFQNELKREKAYLKANPHDKPYFGDGLPFQPIDEVCSTSHRPIHKALTVGPRTTYASGGASVRATFAFPKPCRQPDTTIYTIKLVRSGSGWAIDDVLYEGDRNLVGDLKRKDY